VVIEKKFASKRLLTNRCCGLELFLDNDLKNILPNHSHKTVNWVIMWKTFFFAKAICEWVWTGQPSSCKIRWFSPEIDKDTHNNKPFIQVKGQHTYKHTYIHVCIKSKYKW